jgi:L-fuconolactonase
VTLADAHAHLFRDGYAGRYGRPSSGGDDLAVYESLRREHRIDLALVIGYEGEPGYAGNNDHVAALAAGREWIAPLAYVDPGAPAVPGPPFLGISLALMRPEDGKRLAGWPEATLHGLAERGAIVSVNAVPETLAPALGVLAGLDGARVLISHLGEPGVYARPPDRAATEVALGPLISLADHGHVGVKLSGLYAMTDPAHGYPHAQLRPLIERVADAFGAERLYWGSDFSPALDHVSFAQAVDAVAGLGWSPAERAAIMGGNLRALVAAAREPR